MTIDRGGEPGPSPTSVSFVNTLAEIAVSSLPENASSVGSGARLIAIVVTAVFELALPSLTIVLMMRAVVAGVSVVFSNWINCIAAAYCAFVAVPVNVTTVLVRVHAIVPIVPDAAVEPLTSNRSPVCWLVSVTLADSRLASSTSVMTASVSAIETAAPFSVNVVENPVPAALPSRSTTGAVFVTVPVRVAVDSPPLASAIVYVNDGLPT